MTVGDLLRRAAARPDLGLRILDRDERPWWYPWPEVAERAAAAAGRLAAAGVCRGDRVALVYPTGIEFFEAFLGIVLAGAVPVPLYPPVRLGRLAEYEARTAAMLRAAGVRLVLAETRIRRLLGRAVVPAAPELGCRLLGELPDGPPLWSAPDPADLGLVQFSSGTTVDPKPVALSHRAVVAQAVRLNRFWPQSGARQPDAGVSWLPLYHDMGLIGCVMPAMEAPGTLTLLPPELFVARPSSWLRAISEHHGTISPAPSFAYGLCVDRIRDDELDGVDLSRWRVALNGAEPVAPRVARAFCERFSRWGFRREAMTPVYGLSEAALAVTFSDLDGPFRSRRLDRTRLACDGVAVDAADGVEVASVGRPLPDFEVRVADGVGAALPDGSIGRILVRGPSLMAGYLGRSDLTAAALRDGWLDTGDLGFVSAGELYVTGRAKEVLILRGANHAPHEVEQAAWSVDGARTGCAVAATWRTDDGDHDRLLVLVEAAGGVAADLWPAVGERSRLAVRAATGLEPDDVAVLAPGTLPRTSSGKLRRRESLARWLDGSLGPPDRVSPLTLAGALLRSSLAFARRNRRGEVG